MKTTCCCVCAEEVSSNASDSRSPFCKRERALSTEDRRTCSLRSKRIPDLGKARHLTFFIAAALFLLAFAGYPASGRADYINALDFTNFAGQPGTSGSADGTGTAAQFYAPRGVAVDGAGNLYVADYYNDTIRMITPAGVVTTLAGSGIAGHADGTGSAATFDRPNGIAVDSSGNVYVGCLDGTIRKITTPDGVVTTVAGTAAGFISPTGIAVDSSGNLFVVDSYNETVSKITPAGAVTTLAGKKGTAGYADGTGTAAIFYAPTGIAVDAAGNLYVTDYEYGLIRKVTAGGVVTTIAGLAGTGSADGTGDTAEFNHPSGIAIDSAGNLFVTDRDNSTIRKLTLSGSTWYVTTMAGSPGSSGTADGAGSAARFSQPEGVAVSGLVMNGTGTVYVADTQNQRITEGTPVDLFIPPTITTATPLPAGTVGEAYSQTLAATGGTMPYTWSLTSGSLPAGLSLSSDGVISGTLNEMPTASFTVQVAGADGDASQKTFTIDAPPTITATSPLPAGAVGTSYNNRLTATGGTTPYSWSLASGSLPAGLTLYSNGTISGTPTAAIDASFEVQVTDGHSLSSTKTYTLAIVPVITSPATLPAGAVDWPYSQTLAAGGGTSPYTWTIVSGNLPAGWSLSSDGVLTGTPDAETTFSFNAQTTDANGLSTTKSFTITVEPAQPTITTATILPPGKVGIAYSQTLAASGGSPPYTWAIIYGGVPSGLSPPTSSGVIAGTPSIETVARFRVQVTAANGLTATKDFKLSIYTPLPAADSYSFANFVGQPGTAGSADGTGSAAQFNFPGGLVLDGQGNLFVADSWNDTIRKITPQGVVTTLAGTAGQPGTTDGTGADARFNNPFGIAIDNSGNLLVADTSNHTIRKVTPQGVVTTLAGSAGSPGGTDGTGSEARFYYPSGVVVDGAGNLFVSDAQYCLIRKITPEAVVTTVAGSGSSGHTDGTGTAASFSNPAGIRIGSDGNFYIADEGNDSIRKMTPEAVVTTIAGLSGTSGSVDGTGDAARFYYPTGLAVDDADNLIVADYFNDTIREVTPGQVVTTIGGTAGTAGSIDGTGTAALFYNPRDVAIDREGNLYVSDGRNDRISKGTPIYLQPLITAADPLPDASLGGSYSQTLTALGGTALYTWTLVSGALPAGMTLSADGTLSGTPGTAAQADFTLQVTDSDGQTASKAFHLTTDAPLTITTTSPLPGGVTGTAYQQSLTADGGSGFYAGFAVTSGSLPAGLTLSENGVIAGVPEAAATAEFTVTLTDVDGPSVAKSFSLTVSAPTYRDLTVDFGVNGLWNYSGSVWNQLTTLNADLMTKWEGGVAVDFSSSGLWSYNGSSWDSLTTNNPQEMVGWSQGLTADFGTLGLWNYDGTNWSPLTTWDPQNMVAWSGGLAVDFGASGLWTYDGSTWTLLTTHDAEAMKAWSGGLAVDFGTFGLWNYDGTNWTLLTTNDATMMQSWDGGLAVDFSNGLWSCDGSSWTFLTASHPEGMAAWNNGLAADLGTSGLWSYDGSSWSLLTTQNAQAMEGWVNGLAVDLGGAGLWTYDGADWSQLTTWDADEMIAVNLN